MIKPFDNLPNVTRAIEMYKNGAPFSAIQCEFETSYRSVRAMLFMHNVPKRTKNVPFSRIKSKTVRIIKDKYFYLLDEPINKGKSYKEYLPGFNIQKPKVGSFDKMRKYKMLEEKNPS